MKSVIFFIWYLFYEITNSFEIKFFSFYARLLTLSFKYVPSNFLTMCLQRLNLKVGLHVFSTSTDYVLNTNLYLYTLNKNIIYLRRRRRSEGRRSLAGEDLDTTDLSVRVPVFGEFTFRSPEIFGNMTSKSKNSKERINFSDICANCVWTFG